MSVLIRPGAWRADLVRSELGLAAYAAASVSLVWSGRKLVDWGAGLQRLGVRVLAGAATSERTRLIHRH